MLRAFRAKHGADTPIGHACSNLLELTENLKKENDPATRAAIVRNIDRQRRHLAALMATERVSKA